jgi:hypothetical protein
MKLNYISLTVPLGPSRKSPDIRRDPSIHLTGASYKGSLYNVLVHWEDGLKTFEPLYVMAKEDPITCAKHAKDNDFLDKL